MSEKEIELTSKQKAIKINSEKEANLVYKEIIRITKAVLLASLIMLTGLLIGLGI